MNLGVKGHIIDFTIIFEQHVDESDEINIDNICTPIVSFYLQK